MKRPCHVCGGSGGGDEPVTKCGACDGTGYELCMRCADQGEVAFATHDELCDSCHVSAGEAQDERAAEEQY